MNFGELHKIHRNSKLPSVLEKQGAVSQLSFEIKWCCVSGAGPSSSSGLYHKCKKSPPEHVHSLIYLLFDMRLSQEKKKNNKTKSFQFSLFVTRKESKSKQVSTCLWILQEVWLSLPGAPWRCCHRPCCSHWHLPVMITNLCVISSSNSFNFGFWSLNIINQELMQNQGTLLKISQKYCSAIPKAGMCWSSTLWFLQHWIFERGCSTRAVRVAQNK